MIYPKQNKLNYTYPCPRCKGSGKRKWLEDGVLGLISNVLLGREDCPLCQGGEKVFYWTKQMRKDGMNKCDYFIVRLEKR